MMRVLCTGLVVVLGVWPWTTTAQTPRSGRPNIIYIMTDDHAAHAISAYGSKVNTTPLIQSTASEQYGQMSPDGRWLAYSSNETGVSEIYVQSAAANGGKWAISTGGGYVPRWRGDSGELYYVAGGKMWAVKMTTKGVALIPEAPKSLFDQSPVPPHPGGYFSYAVAQDGQRFLLSSHGTDADGEAASNPIVVVLNWQVGITR